jgi:pyruvate/2-oxoglutarate dehydrogenase complex dihydrolipoamide acyltransferase (E2) component
MLRPYLKEFTIMYEVTMPKMGMAMEDGEIVEWFVEEGTYVNEGDIVLSIMTEKATVEVDSPISGLLVEIRAKNGDIVPIGEVIAVVDLDAEPPK